MKQISIIAAFVIMLVHALGDYRQNGDNWTGDCKKDNQGPIDLKLNMKKLNARKDGFFKYYENLYGVKLQYKWSQFYVRFPRRSGSYFRTNKHYAQNSERHQHQFFGAEPCTEYRPHKIYLKSQSEHTIENKQFDFELQIRHNCKSQGGFDAQMSILFDKIEYNKNVTTNQVDIIDKFFDDLQLDKTEITTIPRLSIGDLLMALDMNNRWTYRARPSSEGCNSPWHLQKYLYYNVLTQVYPIKEKHLNYFRDTQLVKDKGQDLRKTGNWRRTQEITNQEPRLVTTDYFEWGFWQIMVALFGILSGFLFFFSLGVIVTIIVIKRDSILKIVGQKNPKMEGVVKSKVNSHIKLANNSMDQSISVDNPIVLDKKVNNGVKRSSTKKQ